MDMTLRLTTKRAGAARKRRSTTQHALAQLERSTLPHWRQQMLLIYSQARASPHFDGFHQDCRTELRSLGLDAERLAFLEAQWWLGCYADAAAHARNRATFSRLLRWQWGHRLTRGKRVQANRWNFVVDLASLLEDLGVKRSTSAGSVMVRALNCIWAQSSPDAEDIRSSLRSWALARAKAETSAQQAAQVAVLSTIGDVLGVDNKVE